MVAGGSIIMPMLISTLATTRSMTRKGRNRKKPISKAFFSSEIMKAGVITRMGRSIFSLVGCSFDRWTKRSRSLPSTWASMKALIGADAASKAWGISISWSISGLMPS